MKNCRECKEDGTLYMALRKLNRAQHHRMRMEFCKIGITQGQPKILDYLIENDGCIQRELAENCRIEAATVTSILASMERAELIYRKPNPNDRRILNVYLTEKGRLAQSKVTEAFKLVDEECFEGFSDEERVKTIELLNRLYKNVAKGVRCND